MVVAYGEKKTTKGKLQIPEELYILPSAEPVLYPSLIVPLTIRDEKTIKLTDEVVAGDKVVGCFAQRPKSKEAPPANLYTIGTAALVARMFKLPEGSIHVFLQGLSRIKLKEIVQVEPHIKAKVELIKDKVEKSKELEALTRNLTGLFQKTVELAPNLPSELNFAVLNIPDPSSLADFIAVHVNLKLEERQEILELIDVTERIKKLTSFVNRELDVLQLGNKIQSEAKEEMTKAQREFYLRQQLKAIQKELGETDERTAEINELKGKIDEAKLSSEAQKEAERELDRLGKMPPGAAEYTVSRTYLDWLINLPWTKTTEDNLDITRASKTLDDDHYDLAKVKERVLDYLAVRKLKSDMKGPILCFVGPPGTGKTSVGQSIARALGRKFIRMSLGGIRDEADIRGHRRTYIGALPGRIIQGLRRAESNNPVLMLDEIDKLGADFRGDPASALIEVLDPEQNFSFVDHYLDVPFDLSKVMFITTANIVDPIPPALLDRMEVIELPGYTENEKLHIVKEFLIPKQLSENGLTPEQLEIADEAILGIIQNYTREAGLRNLEREIGTICRKVARQVAEGEEAITVVTSAKLHDYLGPEKFRHEIAEGTDETGVATGLAWTPAGGDIIFVEATLVPGKGNLTLTGKLGDVMQESAKAALTYTRSLLSRQAKGMLSKYTATIPKDFYEKQDLHIHVPSGAIPKDGPSAGITMAVALVSAITKCPVSKEIGMTGEITLRGKVLPVGGIRDKVLAAHRAGLRKVILPEENRRDLEEIPQQVKEELQFVFVDSIDEALKTALKNRVTPSLE
jgi:ATP-dependent Lon protease